MRRSVLYAGVAALLCLVACRSAQTLPTFWAVPAFQLTDQRGQDFDSKHLNGKIWIADFVYTTCPSICPRMTSQMRQIQTAFPSSADVRLVSFTVDPAHDTPAQLSKYVTENHVDEKMWSFLTGSPQALEHLDKVAFKLGNVIGQMQHSTRFVLVDRQGQIRGFYDTAEGGAVPHLIDDIKALLNS